MKHFLLTLAAAVALTSCLGNKDIPYRVELRSPVLLLPPVKTDSPLKDSNLGRYCRSEAYGITSGKTRYALEIEDVSPLVTPQNIFPGGVLANDEMSALALSVDCGSVAVIRLLEYQTLPPQRAVLHLSWVRALDGKLYTNKTLDLSMEYPQVNADFNEFVRRQNNFSHTVDEWLDNDEKFLASTGSLSPQVFSRFLAYSAVRALLDDQSTLFVAENNAFAAEAALIARQEAEAEQEAARLKQLAQSENALAALEKQRRVIQLEFETERKRLELELLEKKKEALEAAKLLEKDKELFVKQANDAADHERDMAVKAAAADQNSRLAQLNLSIASYASKFYHSGKKLYSEGRLTEALEDLNRSLKLVPDFDWALYLTAVIHYEQKSYDKAIPHFKYLSEEGETALKPYGLLRLHLCEMLSKGESKCLEGITGKSTTWPTPILKLYQGKSTPETCLNDAAHHRASQHAGQLCSANYYIAEYYFVKGQAYDGIRHLKKAIQFKTDWMELGFARSRLGGYSAIK